MERVVDAGADDFHPRRQPEAHQSEDLRTEVILAWRKCRPAFLAKSGETVIRLSMLRITKGKNLKLLYLLALFQLVAGPLVLFQVSVLCKLTIQEIPHEDTGTALRKAWASDEFQAVLTEAKLGKRDQPSPLPTSDPNGKPVKMPVIAWAIPPVLILQNPQPVPRPDWGRTWASALAQAPPAPPPRIG